MFGVAWVEWIGYAASLFIAISLLMTSVIKLRVINSIGCVFFIIYAFLVKAYPVAVANTIIVLINLYQLYKLDVFSEKNR
ncbi:lactate dehydrogenase [Sporanaerobium hydrogeniformans]|uniref:Lactate dehydrogenase n=1 Tax=Sporanaerobium hydrogeniformans TaxID=3072179 RepID=A0AC61DHH1_9FIRM|nr:YgjV family protein [Sporanaerobium hydrogeniformans]PHV72238.1 lactate dehydrogenase [Sporanaerobium hydrogeniformans]